ncbi:MAG: YbaB/EbfC family nucleoid-associated protein [Dehalococcoidia bacterium]
MAKARGGMFRQPKKARGQGAAAAGGLNAEMVRQAQELQDKLHQAQADLQEATVEATAGGGVVSVVLGGDHRLRSVTIDPDVLDPDDSEMVQDLIIAAVNEANDKLQALQDERMAGLTAGLPLDLT